MNPRPCTAATAALLCLLAVPACRDLRGDPALERGSTLIIASDGQEDDLVLYGHARSLLFLSMLRNGDDGEVTGNLARSWTHSLDGRDWTFHLRSDVKWHDGVPVTARDFAFTFDLLGDPAVTEASPDVFDFVKAVDDTTLVLRSRGAWTVENWTWEIALPEHLLRDENRKLFRGWDFWKAPVGNGPFRYSRALPRTMIELVANQDHYTGRPSIDRVVIKFVGGAGLTEFMAGKVDVLGRVSAADALRVSKDPRFRLYHWFNTSLANAVLWRHDNPLFTDPNVRSALTLGIDRRGLMSMLHLPESAPVPDAIYTQRQFNRGELPAPLPFDRAEAERLLREAGWQDTDGDGVLDRDGQQFRFTMIVPDMWYGVSQTAVYVKDQLRRLGVVVELQPLPSMVARQRLRSGEFEAYLGFVPMNPDGLERFLGAEGFTGYRNPRIREMAAVAARTADLDERDRLYREMTEVYRAELPATPLFPFAVMWAAHRRVQGLSSPFRTNVTDFIAELWLEDDGVPAQGKR
jgi:peptide/nickel transport system substrate-binding protein